MSCMDDEGNRGGNLGRTRTVGRLIRADVLRGGGEGRYGKVCGFVLSLQFKLGIIGRFYIFTIYLPS